ncbi:MAG: class I SAM-dependent methyltransferase [Novosphingobium sp.]
MERIVFDRMAELDQTHWWYVARRRILTDLIAREINPPKDAQILEIGCGTGHNFPVLERFGHVDALELDEPARALASKRLGREIGAAPLPDLDGVADSHYDLIALLDVLEHIEADREALTNIRTKLRPGGRLLVTVPANQWMWSAHDIVHHHYRRYNPRSLRNVAEKAELRLEFISHFNTLLFPLAAALRVAGKVTGREEADDAQPPAPLNAMFAGVFGLERHLIGRVPMPFGVSLAAVLSRPE